MHRPFNMSLTPLENYQNKAGLNVKLGKNGNWLERREKDQAQPDVGLRIARHEMEGRGSRELDVQGHGQSVILVS